MPFGDAKKQSASEDQEFDRALVHIELLEAEHDRFVDQGLAAVASRPSTGPITITVSFPFTCTATATVSITAMATAAITAMGVQGQGSEERHGERSSGIGPPPPVK
jgi:hypothetical protein